MILCITINETLKWLSSLPVLMMESFWWWQCSDRYIISLFPHLHTPSPFSPSLISLTVSVGVKHHVYYFFTLTGLNLGYSVSGQGESTQCFRGMRDPAGRHGTLKWQFEPNHSHHNNTETYRSCRGTGTNRTLQGFEPSAPFAQSVLIARAEIIQPTGVI